MPLRVHDTRRREKVEFSTLSPGRVSMYVCGVTVYDRCHLGHARCYIAFDLVHRWLEASGYDVDYVQNFTDIDDKSSFVRLKPVKIGAKSLKGTSNCTMRTWMF